MTQYISIKEMRQHFGKVREGLGNGVSYIVIYRSQPIAELKPLDKQESEGNQLARLFANPPQNLKIQSQSSGADLVRAERDSL